MKDCPQWYEPAAVLMLSLCLQAVRDGGWCALALQGPCLCQSNLPEQQRGRSLSGAACQTSVTTLVVIRQADGWQKQPLSGNSDHRLCGVGGWQRARIQEEKQQVS